MKTWISESPTLPFDAIASEELKAAGMDRAADNKKALVRHARKIARELAARLGTVSMDDVQFEMYRRDNISVHALGNAAGAIFQEKENGSPVWQWTGQFIKSKRVHAHSNLIRTWRLRTR